MATLPPVPPPPARALSLGDILVGSGAVIAFGFSFAPFVQWNESARQELGLSNNVSVQFNAWSLEMFMVPLTTFVIVAILLAAAGVATRFALRRDPTLVGFRLRQLEVGLALFGFVVLLAMVVSEKSFLLGYDRFADAELFQPDEGGVDTAWGSVLMLLGALIALVGAVLNHLGLALSIGVHVNQPASPYPGQPTYPPASYQPPPPQPPTGQSPPPQPSPPPAPPAQPFPAQRDPSPFDQSGPGSS